MMETSRRGMNSSGFSYTITRFSTEEITSLFYITNKDPLCNQTVYWST